MSVADMFEEYMDGNEYDCIEEYNADILRCSNSLIEDVGREERYYLEHPENLNVKIKGVENDA